MKLRNRQRQNLRTRQVIRYVTIVALSLGALRALVLLTNYFLSTESSHAKAINLVENDGINNGEVITQLQWGNSTEKNNSILEDVLSMSKDAYYKEDKNGFSGIAAGKKGKNLDIVLKENDLLNSSNKKVSQKTRLCIWMG